MRLTIATSQFAVSADIQENKVCILEQMQHAKNSGADVIHFPEGSLSGYAGIDFDSFEGFDWESLLNSSKEILSAAKKLKVWVILGSTHRLSGINKPHNSLYIINNKGEIADRYDKMFCAGDITEQIGDLEHYTPGNHFCCFEINKIKCGTLICHDYRYPELYREYKKMGVQLMFHSYHAGNMRPERKLLMEEEVGFDHHAVNHGKTLPEITQPATMISYAANNYIWISCSNTSAKESCWPAFMVRPDGVITGKLRKNKADILITTIDTEREYYDSTKAWRERAMNRVYNSGTLVRDKRSEERTEL